MTAKTSLGPFDDVGPTKGFRHGARARLARKPGRRYDRPVKEHLDLQGASGATYRFRLIGDPDELPATSGNFAYVRWRGPTPQVACCGAVNSLTSANRLWDEAVRVHGAQGLYIRLNVARALREEEHADLVEKLRPPMAAHSEA